MKSTDTFKKTIQDYLENRSKTDPLFAISFAKEGKNIDDCVNYILSTVQASGCNGFADEEIFSMAVHYYDEDNIKVGAAISGRVVVNHKVVLTDKEKADIKANAEKQYKDEVFASLKPKTKPVMVVQKNSLFGQTSLFD